MNAHPYAAAPSPRPAYADGRPALVTFPTELCLQDEDLEPDEVLNRKLDALSLRILGGHFAGSLTNLANEHGVLKQTLSKHVRGMAAQLGVKMYFVSDQHRKRLSDAARESHRFRKSDPTPEQKKQREAEKARRKAQYERERYARKKAGALFTPPAVRNQEAPSS